MGIGCEMATCIKCSLTKIIGDGQRILLRYPMLTETCGIQKSLFQAKSVALTFMVALIGQ